MAIPLALIGNAASLMLSRPSRAQAKPTLKVRVDAQNVTLKLNRFAQKLDDFRRFWIEYFAPQFFHDIQDNFATSGKYVGGWRALSPAYAAWKLAHYGVRPILVATGEMRESLRLGGRGNIARATKTAFQGGSSNKKVPKHQAGIGVPVRRVVFLRPGRVYQRILGEYVRDEMRASGFSNVRSA